MTQTDIIISSRITREFPVERDLQECVESLAKHTKNFRLIFIDDNSDSVGRVCIETLASGFSNSLLLRTYYQRWFTRAYNLGFMLVRTPYCVALNCDTVLGDGWLEELYSVKDEVESAVGKVGLVGSDPPVDTKRYALSVERDAVSSYGALFNMDAMKEVAMTRNTPGVYFDETRADAIHIYSDVYICWEMNRLGWQVVKSFKADIRHKGAKCWGQNLGSIPDDVSVVNEKYI